MGFRDSASSMTCRATDLPFSMIAFIAFGDLNCHDRESNILEFTVEGPVFLLLHKLNVSVTINSAKVHCSISIFEPVARDRGPWAGRLVPHSTLEKLELDNQLVLLRCSFSWDVELIEALFETVKNDTSFVW